MPLFLAGLLSRDGVVPPRVIEEALQRQVLAGGALDSSLLELGVLDEERLGEYLARASGLRLATAEQLAQPDPRLRKLFPLRLAERHGLVPFAQSGRTLQMACAYPADAALLEEMGFLLSQKIEAWIAPEFRVRLAIERLYGHPASARMHELAQRFGAELPPAPPTVAEKPPGDPERSLAPDWTVNEALARLEAATDRDEAIEVTLRFGRRTFSYVALFGLVGGKAIGWDAVAAEPGAEHRVKQVVQSLGEDTVLATVMRTQGRYLGPVADTEPNRKLLERMGRSMPRTAFVQPVEVGGRLVALVWADDGDGEVASEAAAEMMVVVQTLGQTLERLVRERKAAAAAGTAAALGAAPAPAQAASPGSEGAAEAVQASDAAPAAVADEPEVVAPFPGAETPEERAAASPAARANTDRFYARRSAAMTGLQQACKGAEELLHACSDAERAEALARIAGSGSIGAEVLVALLPGPVRTDPSGALAGGVILDALAALGPWAVPALSRAASSHSSAVRYWVAVLLAGSNDPAGHAALARLANDRDPHVAAVARTAVKPVS